MIERYHWTPTVLDWQVESVLLALREQYWRHGILVRPDTVARKPTEGVDIFAGLEMGDNAFRW